MDSRSGGETQLLSVYPASVQAWVYSEPYHRVGPVLRLAEPWGTSMMSTLVGMSYFILFFGCQLLQRVALEYRLLRQVSSWVSEIPIHLFMERYDVC